MRPRDYDGLISALCDGSRRERRAAARALGKLGDPRAAEALGAAFHRAYGEDEGLPRLIVMALGRLHDQRAAASLERALADRRDDSFYLMAHREALFALADLGVFAPLEEVAGDETRDEMIRSEAIVLLERRGPGRLPAK